MTFSKLDLDQDLLTQGYVPASVDVVIAANAVHACIDLKAALRRLRDLLAPGGVLILIESTTHFVWFDMTTGLIEGWQHFADDLRDDQPLLSAPAWIAALTDAGFEQADFWPRDDSAARHLGQHVLVARVAGEVSTGVVVRGADGDSVIETSTVLASEAAASATREQVLAAFPEDRLDLLRDYVRARVVRVLRRDPSDPPDRHDRLTDIGLDSLMAVQLRGQLGAGLGFDRALPATLMFDHPTIDRLALYLLQRLCPEEGSSEMHSDAGPQPESGTPAPLRAAVVAAMTDAEIEALLSQRLDRRSAIEQANVYSNGG